MIVPSFRKKNHCAYIIHGDIINNIKIIKIVKDSSRSSGINLFKSMNIWLFARWMIMLTISMFSWMTANLINSSLWNWKLNKWESILIAQSHSLRLSAEKLKGAIINILVLLLLFWKKDLKEIIYSKLWGRNHYIRIITSSSITSQLESTWLACFFRHLKSQKILLLVYTRKQSLVLLRKK